MRFPAARVRTDASREAHTMTEPTRPDAGPAAPPDEDGAGDPYADLEQRPVSEHVAVFEAEHARLQRELGTIDQV
jgi:hypothetical protein